jgi:hypothetical protein
VHLVEAVELDPPILEVIAKHQVHAPIGPLTVGAHRRRKDDDARPRMSEYLQVHVSVERRAVPTGVFVMH